MSTSCLSHSSLSFILNHQHSHLIIHIHTRSFIIAYVYSLSDSITHLLGSIIGSHTQSFYNSQTYWSITSTPTQYTCILKKINIFWHKRIKCNALNSHFHSRFFSPLVLLAQMLARERGTAERDSACSSVLKPRFPDAGPPRRPAGNSSPSASFTFPRAKNICTLSHNGCLELTVEE